jgi:hypothetical protein
MMGAHIDFNVMYDKRTRTRATVYSFRYNCYPPKTLPKGTTIPYFEPPKTFNATQDALEYVEQKTKEVFARGLAESVEVFENGKSTQVIEKE